MLIKIKTDIVYTKTINKSSILIKKRNFLATICCKGGLSISLLPYLFFGYCCMKKSLFLKILSAPFQFAKSHQFFTTRSVETHSDFYLFFL